MSGSYKNEVRKTSLTAAIGDAYSELQSLRDEMTEWRDNMENGNLGSTPKFEEVSSCVDQMESGGDLDSEPDVPDGFDPEITYTESVPRRKRQNASRSTRCSNACAMLDAAIDVIEERKAEIEELPTTDALSKESDALETLRDEIQQIKEACESAEFPGMF